MLEATIVSKRTVGLRANGSSADREILDPELLNLFSLLGRSNAGQLACRHLPDGGRTASFVFCSCYQVLVKFPKHLRGTCNTENVGQVPVQILYKRAEIPANKMVPAIAVSVTYSKQEKAANTGSIPVGTTMFP